MKTKEYAKVEHGGGVYHVVKDVEEKIENESGGGVEIRRNHPSFGKARLSRRSGTTALFGSDLKHHGFITLSIMRAEECWHLGQHWNHERATLIEIDLSYSQFVRLMGNMNAGEGADCTISFVAHTPKEDCGSILAPQIKPNVQELTETEMAKATERACTEIGEAYEELSALIDSKKSFSKGDMRVALDAMGRMHRKMKGNEWGVNVCYKEQMEKLTNEAKTEADAYIHNAILELGERSLAKAIASGDITREQVKNVLAGAKVKMLPKAEEFKRMQCPACGTIFTDGEIDCILCGTELEEMDD